MIAKFLNITKMILATGDQNENMMKNCPSGLKFYLISISREKKRES